MLRLIAFRPVVFGLCILLLAVMLACGEETTPAATSAEEAPVATTAPSVATESAATPVATPTPDTRPAMMSPQGTLQIAIGAVGADVYLPKSQDYNTAIYDERVTHETIFAAASDGTRLGRLVKSWDDQIGTDGSFVRTYNLQEGVKWHQRYGDFGEWNADDFIHSFQNVSAEGSRHTTSTSIRDSFFCDGCTLTKIDDMTVRLERPTFDVALDFYTVYPNAIMAMRSKAHFDTVGEATAEHQSVGTGPWELMEVSLNEKKIAKAVTDHWRKTPEWDEFVWWEIGEESTKYANFVTGVIDSGQFSSDSIQALKGENLPDVEFGVFHGADLHYLHLHGANYYPDHPYHQPGPAGEDPVLPTGDNSSLLVGRTALGVRGDIQGVAAPSPLRHYKAFYNAANRFTFSPEHPELQALVDKALNTPDEQERWGVEAEIAVWLYDQVGTIPLYEGASIWPFGPELGEWEVNPLHVEWLNNWEYAPHK